MSEESLLERVTAAAEERQLSLSSCPRRSIRPAPTNNYRETQKLGAFNAFVTTWRTSLIGLFRLW